MRVGSQSGLAERVSECRLDSTGCGCGCGCGGGEGEPVNGKWWWSGGGVVE